MIATHRYRSQRVSLAGSTAILPRQAAEQPDDDAAWIAQRIAADAGAQAAVLARQASAHTATIRRTAEREAEEIRRRAAAQAAAIREAAEREAAQLRAAVIELSAGRAGQIAVPAGRSTAVAPPRPATKPRPRGTARTRGRQARAMRKVAIAFVVLSLAGVTSGAAEIKLHGLSFFLFRNAGAGAGNSRDLTENQGPGQPGAPRPHHPAVAPGAHATSSRQGSDRHDQ